MHFVNQNTIEVKQLQQLAKVRQTGIADASLADLLKNMTGYPVIQYNGRLVQLEGFTGNIVHDLTLHELPDFSNYWHHRREAATAICIHHTDKSPRTAFTHFHRPTYKHLSTHFLVGRHPKTKNLEVIQCLDTTVAAKHIGKTNDFTISVDLCEVYDDEGKIDNELLEYSNNFIKCLHTIINTDKSKAPLISSEKHPVKILEQHSLFASHNVSISHEGLENYIYDICKGI